MSRFNDLKKIAALQEVEDRQLPDLNKSLIITSIKITFDLSLTSWKYRMVAYSRRARKTKNMQAIIQEAMAVIPSTLGETLVMVLKMLVSTRKRVTRRAIRPGTTSGGMRKLTQDTTTNSPDGK